MSSNTYAGAICGRRVLVTGARGFLGGALCQALTAAGAQVHGSSRRDLPHQDRRGIRWWRSDPADPAAAEALIRDVAPDLVFHMSAAVTGARDLAAVLPTFQDGLASTVNLLSSVTKYGVNQLVLAGSVEARCQDGAPRSPYAASKAAAASYARMFGALFGVRCVDVRISMTYGPGQSDQRKLIPYVLNEIRSGRSPSLTSGTRLADWIYVDDTVAALLAAAVSPEAVGRSIEIGTGVLTPVRKVVERLVALVNPAVRPSFGVVRERAFEDEAPVDPSPACELLGGWRAHIKLDEGLRRTAATALEPSAVMEAPRGCS